jgi:hypothetical protein
MSGSQSSDKSLLRVSEYNVLQELKKADFLYSAMEKYVHYAEKDIKPGLLTLRNTIKGEEQNYLKILRSKLIKELN